MREDVNAKVEDEILIKVFQKKGRLHGRNENQDNFLDVCVEKELFLANPFYS